MLNFKLASIVLDRHLLEKAKEIAEILINDDPELKTDENLCLKRFLQTQQGKTVWRKIS
jgi:ATP-dependent DNA helicase RecG